MIKKNRKWNRQLTWLSIIIRWQLLQGDEITVSITSGNGDYYVKPFDESVATATINGNKVTIKATENSQLEENNRTETTILIVVGI